MIYISSPGILPFRLPGTQLLQAKADFVTGHAPKFTAAPAPGPTARHIYHGHKVVRQARRVQAQPAATVPGRARVQQLRSPLKMCGSGQLRESLDMHGEDRGHGRLPCSRDVRSMVTVSGHKVAFLCLPVQVRYNHEFSDIFPRLWRRADPCHGNRLRRRLTSVRSMPQCPALSSAGQASVGAGTHANVLWAGKVQSGKVRAQPVSGIFHCQERSWFIYPKNRS